MPRHRRAALAASALLAVMLPPTGADFAFRSFQLPLAILAGIVILAVALLVVRRELRTAGPIDEADDGAVPNPTEPPEVGDDLGAAPLDDAPDGTTSNGASPNEPTRPDVTGSPLRPRAPAETVSYRPRPKLPP